MRYCHNLGPAGRFGKRETETLLVYLRGSRWAPRFSVRTMRLLLAATLLAWSTADLAQAAPIRQSIAASAGVTFPLAPAAFSDLWSPGLALAGSVRFRIVPRFHLNLEVGYYRHLSNKEAFNAFIGEQQANVTLSGYDLWVVPVSLVGEYDLIKRRNTKPYAIFGLGVYKFGVTDASLSGFGSELVVLPDPTETAFGVQLGLGVRTPVSVGTTLFLDAVWHMSATEGEARQFMPVRLGLQF
jgi:hypothetical protein